MTSPDPHQPTQADPTADPAASVPPDAAGSAAADPMRSTPHDDDHQSLLDERNELRRYVATVEHTRTRATFIGLVIGAIIAILLLVFILMNLDDQEVNIFGWHVNLPLGVSLLIAAITGALIVAVVGGLRMIQLSRALKKAKG